MTYRTNRRRRTGAAVRVGAALAALALATSACSGGDDPSGSGDGAEAVDPGANPEPQGEPQQGGSLTVALEGETNGWQPGISAPSAPGFNVMYSIYDPLVIGTGEGSFEPYLAESFEPNEDFTAWTFTLREGVTFHDGSALTADVVAQNVAVLKEPTSNLAGVLSEVASVAAVDPLTVRYDLARPNAAFPALLTTTAGMPFSMENFSALGPEEANAEPVGTGPFVFESWVRDDRLTVTANESYWGTDLGLGPYLDEIVFRPIPDEDSRLQSMLSGDVDAFQTLRESIVGQAQDAAADGEIALHTFLGNNGGTTILNTLAAPLDDVRVRQALAHAADREQLIEVLGGTGITEPRTQFFTEDSPYYSEAVAEAYPAYDPERATELLQEYIDDPERSDGKAAGEPVTVQYNCQPDPSLTELAQAYQAFWSNIGVEVAVNSVDQATHIGNAVGSPASDPAFAGDYLANCWRTSAEGDPFNILKNEFGPVPLQPLNFTNYTSETLDEQLAVLATTTDEEARRAAVEEIGLELAENVPVLWVSSTVAAFGVDPAVQNLSDWQLPGGADGVGLGLFQGGSTMWGQVWLAE
ncbi:ABC transporter substrate-binding protein [Blastococcus xanthinilyticus]|uniref:Peptide/nickel transport system substrate-binding protein n=1 Tax=Blastococcus xanthinilyticus TaxID=1564164 RepID=A0A5S5D7A8_9ACTN|nr:ABC transporter substrate-binding protein [Blastococcus xanthinilyticus]TYP90509.1 peptide/nickel transport system substrate-binding protein [Blastococcus xanthinilyticus]